MFPVLVAHRRPEAKGVRQDQALSLLPAQLLFRWKTAHASFPYFDESKEASDKKVRDELEIYRALIVLKGDEGS